jgi:hypothetical protein
VTVADTFSRGTVVASSHLSIRVDDSIIERLDIESRRLDKSRSDLAKTLIDEGLRMLAHPGIVFRPGPAGRRPGLACGADIWEVSRVIRALAGTSDTWVDQVSELTSIPPDDVVTAWRYYSAYRDEIDAWIQWVDDEAERAEAAWLREQALLTR